MGKGFFRKIESNACLNKGIQYPRQVGISATLRPVSRIEHLASKSKKPHNYIQPDHSESNCHLGRCTYNYTDQNTCSGLCCRCGFFLYCKFTNKGANKRPDKNTYQSKEESDNCTYDRAESCPLTRPAFLSTQCPGNKINQKSQTFLLQ